MVLIETVLSAPANRLAVFCDTFHSLDFTTFPGGFVAIVKRSGYAFSNSSTAIVCGVVIECLGFNLPKYSFPPLMTFDPRLFVHNS